MTEQNSFIPFVISTLLIKKPLSEPEETPERDVTGAFADAAVSVHLAL